MISLSIPYPFLRAMLQSLLFSSAKKDEPEQLTEGADEMTEPDPRLLELVQEGLAPSINVVKTAVDPLVIREIISHQTSLRKVLAIIDKGFKVLEVENQLIIRLVYKGKNKYRNDHGFKTLQILKKSVEKCLMNYPKSYIEEFLDMLPRVVHVSVHLPPASLAEYAGLRTWVAIQSLQRIMHCCHLSAVHASRRVTLSHEVHAAILRLSISGRIWVVAKFLLKHMATVMEGLYGCSQRIPIGKNFYCEEDLGRIFSGYTDQKSTVTLTEEVIESFEVGCKVSRSYIDEEKLRQDSLVESFGWSEKVSESDHRKENRSLKKSKILESLSFSGMVAESDKKESKAVKLPNKEINKIKESKNNYEEIDSAIIALYNLKTLDDLKSFLESETQKRKVNRKAALTRKLSQDQWKDLKRRVLSNIKPNLPKTSIKQGRKLIKEALFN